MCVCENLDKINISGIYFGISNLINHLKIYVFTPRRIAGSIMFHNITTYLFFFFLSNKYILSEHSKKKNYWPQTFECACVCGVCVCACVRGVCVCACVRVRVCVLCVCVWYRIVSETERNVIIVSLEPN